MLTYIWGLIKYELNLFNSIPLSETLSKLLGAKDKEKSMQSNNNIKLCFGEIKITGSQTDM